MTPDFPLGCRRVIGLKQVTKAVKSGRAEMVYVAKDAQRHLKEPLTALCREAGARFSEECSLKELGEAAGIAVGAAAVACLKR